MKIDENNRAFRAALLLLEETQYSVFLTGKAGTGKTTFLRYIRRYLDKKMLVVAPTGVAAVNARGMTIHSLFNIQPSVYPPNDPRLRHSAPTSAKDKSSIHNHFKYSRERKKLLQEAELIVIDEISMVRADLLDVIDRLLRTFGGRRHLPFGGKQMLFIGDAFQLPPVTPYEEWDILRPFYSTPYFFGAESWLLANPKTVELQNVYRQSDRHFVDILNRLREGRQLQQDLLALNKRYVPPGFDYAKQGYIYLGCTNRDVDHRNARELDRLSTELYRYQARVEGEFERADMPTLAQLELKVGAQVMFVRNDTGESRRFFNGKIGKITALKKDAIIVDCTVPGGPELDPIEVEPAEWRKIRFEWDKEEKCIKEIEIGRFVQFPLKLAWAITVHKSQGLTFERVFANLRNAFAAGQTYVALSRCTSVEGLRLATRLQSRDVKVAAEVLAFTERYMDDADIEEVLTIIGLRAEMEEAENLLEQQDLAGAVQALMQLKRAFPLFQEQITPLETQILSAIRNLQQE